MGPLLLFPLFLLAKMETVPGAENRSMWQSSYKEGAWVPSLGAAISTLLLMFKLLCEREITFYFVRGTVILAFVIS